MERRRLGRTGHESSVAVFGAATLWDATEEQAAAAFGAALAAGVNHLDVAPQYGRAQELLGPLLATERHRLFVGVKTLRHTADGVRAQLEESLTLLGCDAFDLYQMHAVNTTEELLARRGAMEALQAAAEEGLCRFLGVTGHELTAPATHLEALRRYDLDTVMFPLNPRLWGEADYRRDVEALLAEAAARDVGVMVIKAAAARPWAGRDHTAGTWYEPYTTAHQVAEGIRFALSVPGVHAFCTPGDRDVLRLALDAAGAYRPLVGADAEAVVAARAHEPLIFLPGGDSIGRA
jgi:aryl-alcohol dehydrogenase-like predicted oxidoreductase